MDKNIMAEIAGIITIAASEAIFPLIPISIIIKVTSFGEAPKIVFFINVDNRPTFSANPIPNAIVSTSPNGAKPVKFFTVFAKAKFMPSPEIRFFTFTTS